MNKEKKFFEENSQGQFFYQAEHHDKFQQLHNKAVNAGFDTFSKFSEKFFGTGIDWRKDVFGKQAFCTLDSSNRRIYVWRVDLGYGTLWILSGGNGRGTSYEWYSETGDYDLLYDEIVMFLLDHYGLKNL